ALACPRLRPVAHGAGVPACNNCATQAERSVETSGFIQYAVVLLLAAVIAVPLARRSRLGSVLGYLAAGALIGPSVLNLVGNAEEIAHGAELGVILMLFVIGLELSPQRLWVMRRQVFGLGSIQMVASTIGIGAIALSYGLGWK